MATEFEKVCESIEYHCRLVWEFIAADVCEMDPSCLSDPEVIFELCVDAGRFETFIGSAAQAELSQAIEQYGYQELCKAIAPKINMC